MISTPIKGILIASFTIIAGLYGTLYLLTEALRTILPFGIIFIIITFSLVYALHIPAPPLEIVEKIIGPEPCKLENVNQENIMKVVAHRGAGLDAPENTLAAFKQVFCICIYFCNSKQNFYF